MAIKNDKLDKSNFILYFLIIFIVASSVFFYFEGKSNPISEALSRNQDINTLFVLHDEGQNIATSVYIYNGQTKRGSLFDISGNIGYTFTKLKRVDRIDTVFDPKKPQDYTDAVANLLGLDSIPFYVFIELKQLSALIDLIGGIEIFIANPIKRESDDGQIISLPAGSVVLDGDTAIQFLRITNDRASDNQAIERRQKFMQALLRKLSHTHNIITNKYVEGYTESLLNTNIHGAALNVMWNELSLLDSDSIILQKIAGSTRIVSSKALLFPYHEGKLVKETIRQVVASLKDTQTATVDLWPRKIEIQNGTSRNGLASSTQRIYESMGFTVSKIGNSPTDVSYTVVLDLSGNIESAKKVAEVIRCTRVYSVAQTEESETDSMADVQVILGKDFDGRYAQQITINND